MFSTLGIDDVFDGLSWQRMSTSALRKKLQDFSALRNEVVHGANKRVRKQVLVNHLNVFKNFANQIGCQTSKGHTECGRDASVVTQSGLNPKPTTPSRPRSDRG